MAGTTTRERPGGAYSPSLAAAVAILTAALVVGSMACGDDSTGLTYDPNACTSFQIPNRFGYRWEELNHRLSRWSHHLIRGSGSSGEDESSCQPTHLDTAFSGGTFASGEQRTDTPQLKYAYQGVSGISPRAAGVARRSISTTIRATPPGDNQGVNVDGTADGSVTYRRDALNLEGYERIVAVIEGFEFYTDLPQSASYPNDYNPADGYTSRGIGVTASVSKLTKETITLDWELRFGFGATQDREPMNRAIPHARIGAELDVLLIGSSDARVHQDSVDYTLNYPHQDPFVERVLSHIDTDEQYVELDGDPSYGRGVWGLNAFSIRLAPDVGCTQGQEVCPAGDTCQSDEACARTYGPAGYYIREFSVDVTQTEYDDATGRSEFAIDGFASNASEAITFYALNHRFSAGITWVQVGGEPTREVLDQSHPVGATSIPLDQ